MTNDINKYFDTTINAPKLELEVLELKAEIKRLTIKPCGIDALKAEISTLKAEHKKRCKRKDGQLLAYKKQIERLNGVAKDLSRTAKARILIAKAKEALFPGSATSSIRRIAEKLKLSNATVKWLWYENARNEKSLNGKV